MASKLPPATPRPRAHARTASLDSGGKALPVAKCVSANGGESALKPMPERRSFRPPNTERRTIASRGTELHQIHDDHIKAKEQLALIEKSKSNLMQDLARAKRNVEELTTKLSGVNGTCKKDKGRALDTESVTFSEKEVWQVELDAVKQQYEMALLELQTSKQAMESLKHELMVCVEAKDEAVRLAGEAMNAAESTARRVEELSAELFTTKGSILTEDCTMSEMDDLIDELSKESQSLLEIDMPLEEITHEETCEKSRGENRAEVFSFNSTRAEVEDQKKENVQMKDLETQFKGLNISLKALKSELAAATAAEQKALNDVLVMQADIERAKLEAEKAKNAESATHACLAKVSRNLEEAEEKLVQVSVENATLIASVGFLKAELEKSQYDVLEARNSETNANSKSVELSDCMVKIREANRAEVLMYKEREISARATLESLQMDLERQKLDSVLAAEKELIVTAKIADMIKEVEKSRNELVEHQKHFSYEVAALSMKLETKQSMLAELEEKDSVSATKIASLMVDLEEKQSELGDLQQRLLEMEATAEAVSIELSALQENSLKLVELEAREEKLNAEVGALNAEVHGLKQALEEALNTGQGSREDLCNFEVTLQKVISERDEARSELLAARCQIELSKQIAVNTLAEAQTSRVDAERALDELRTHSNAALEEVLLASKLAKEEAQMAREEARMAREEAHAAVQAALKHAEMANADADKIKKESHAAEERLQAAIKHAEMANADADKIKKQAQSAREDARGVALAAEEKLRAAIKHAEMANADAEKMKKEAQSASEDANLQRTALAVARERANAIEEEAKAVLEEMVELRTELSKSQVDALEAKAAWTNAETRFQAAVEELESYKSSSIKEESLVNHMSEEELAGLKEKLQVCEEQLIRVMNEAEGLQMNKEELLRELEAAKVEREANTRAVLEAHQHLVDMEKAKRVMEADIQRLLDDSKLWKAPKDARDILVLSDINGNSYVLTADSREEKPQPDSPDRESLQDLGTTCLHMDGETRKEDLVIEKEEEIGVEAPIRVGKKKKHALLHRLHSYLDKKKSLNTP